jgi:malonate transporter and related proteins
MSIAAGVILPVFLIIGLGWLARWRGYFGDEAVDALMRYAQNIAAPILLGVSIYGMDLGTAFQPGLLLSFYIGAFSAFALGIFGARALGRPGPDAVAIGFACLFSNSLLLGVAITERAYGTAGLAGNFAIISIHSPIMYTLGIVAMELTRSRGQNLPLHRLTRQIGRSILTQPLIIGILTGFAVNLSGLTLPGFAFDGLKMIAGTTIPTALFGLGGVLFRYRPEGDGLAIALVVAASLGVHPIIAWTLGTQVFALDAPALRSAVITAAMAPGVNAYLFAHMYGVAKRVAASAVLIATGLSIGTTWIWLQILP